MVKVLPVIHFHRATSSIDKTGSSSQFQNEWYEAPRAIKLPCLPDVTDREKVLLRVGDERVLVFASKKGPLVEDEPIVTYLFKPVYPDIALDVLIAARWKKLDQEPSILGI